MDYVAIDFETANSSSTSACSIGIVAIKNDKVVYNEEFLINPCEEFSPFNITIHHITEEDVKDAPTFEELYPRIKKYFDNTIVFAHNADFDIGVLKALVEKYNLEVPNIKVGCTLKIARKLWKDDLPNCKLSTLSGYLEINHNHHDSLSDAFVCTKIIERAKRVRSVSTETELYESLGLKFGVYNDTCFSRSETIYKKRTKKIKIVDNCALKEKVFAYGGKPKNLTKNEFIAKVESNGAFFSSAITVDINYFVIFENCPKTKLKQLRSYKEKGCKIVTLDEDQVLRLLK